MVPCGGIPLDTSRDQLRAALNVSPDAMFVLDKTGTVIELNDAAVELFGYAADELIGKSGRVFVPERTVGYHRQNYANFFVRPVRQKLASPVHLPVLTKSGQEIPVEVTLGPLTMAGSLYAVCSVRDVSAHAKREEQFRSTIDELDRRLRSSELDFRRTNEHFKLFLKNAPAAIALVDRQLRYLIVSDRLLTDYGLTEGDVHGMSMYDVFPEIPERWKELHRRCLAGETLSSHEDSFVRTNGRTEWLTWELHPWRTTDGRIAGMFMASELITARKDAEIALKKSYLELEQRVAERTAELERLKNDATRANTQKSWFVAAASHDLRQPLQASLAYLSVLSRKAGREDIEELCEKSRQPLKAMSDILDVLLDISDLESGHVKPQMQDFALGDLIGRVIANAQHQAQEKGLRLSCLPTDLTVHSDPRLLERVISNFVTNAIRYTEKGLIGIYCEQVGGKVCISVTDTGIGIPADALGAIFEDHVQLDNPARDRRKGLGLGLSIAKRIADALGHRISVQSELGSGSSFSIELPQSRAAVASSAAAPETPAASETHPIVLLIDDDQDVAEAMQMLLQSYDFETYMAHSRDAALAMLESGLNPGIVLCDYRMPGANGIDVIRQVRNTLHTDIPAVIMTGDMGLTSCELKCCAVLHKPVDVGQFFSVLGKLEADR
jgi:PAS domain S-box-containing protein